MQADDQIVAVLQLALEEADRKYDAFKRKVETPLRVTVEGPAAPGAGRTFGGQSVVSGPANLNIPPAQQAVAGVGSLQQQAQAIVVSRTGLGGSGFGPAVGPSPTAYLNTVYGQVSPNVRLSPIGGGGPSPSITPPGFIQPGTTFSPTTGGNGVSYNGIRAPFVIPGLNTMGPVPPAAGPVNPYYGPGGAPGTQGGAPLNLAAFNRGQGQGVYPGTLTTLNPAGAGFGAFAGRQLTSLVSQRALTAYGGAAYFAATTYDRYATESTGIREGLRYDSVEENAQSAFTSTREGNALSRLGGRLGNQFFGTNPNQFRTGYGRLAGFLRDRTIGQLDGANTFNDGTNVDDARDTARQARRNAEIPEGLRANRSLARSIGAIGLTGYAAQSASINNESLTAIGSIDAQIKAAGTGVDVSDLNQRRALLVQGQRQSLLNAAYSSRTATGLIQQTTAGNTRATNITLSGDAFGGRLAAIDAEFQPKINAAVRDYNQGGGTDPVIESNIRGLYSEQSNQRRFSGRQRLDQLADISGQYEEGRGRLAFDPYGGARRGIEERYNGRLRGLDPNQPDAIILRGQRDQELAANAQQNSLATSDLSTSQRYRSLGLDARLRRDPVGEAAANIAGRGIQDIRDIARSGLGVTLGSEFGVPTTDRSGNDSLVAASRANSLKELDALREGYSRSFVGRQIDLDRIDPDFQRNGQDPSVVFGRIADRERELRGASGREGERGKDETKLNLESMQTLAVLIAQAQIALLAK